LTACFFEFDEHSGMALSVHDLTVMPEGGVRMHTVPYGDTTLLIRYSGDGLRLRAIRLEFDPSRAAEQRASGWCSRGCLPARTRT
jgi:hypothetical protein